MKILTLVAAAAAAVLTVPAASASAVPSATAISTAALAATATVGQDHRRWDRNERRYDRRVHRRSYWRTTCTRKWRNGHRVRVCRKVRYYR